LFNASEKAKYKGYASVSIFSYSINLLCEIVQISLPKYRLLFAPL